MNTPDLEIEIAISNRYDDDSTESNALKAEVNDFSNIHSEASDDYVTYQFIVDTHSKTFTTDLENCLYQFDVFSSSLLKVKQIAGLAMSVFDDYGLSVSGYNLVYLTRNNSGYVGYEDDTELHHYYIEYRIMVDK